METVPSWETPHVFRRFAEGRRPEEVVTYGLFAPALARADLTTDKGVAQLAERVGVEPIFELGGEVLPYADLMAAIESRSVPVEALSRFASGRGGERVAEFIGTFAHLVVELEEAADGRRRPREVSGLDRAGKKVAELFRDYYAREPGPDPQPLRRPDKPDHPFWGFRYRGLAARIVGGELFDIYTHRPRPRLRRCALCERVFAPLGNEKVCRLKLWAFPSYELREHCVSHEQVEAYLARARESEHTRTYRKLHQRWRREVHRSDPPDPDSPRARRARAEFDEYRKERGITGPGPVAKESVNSDNLTRLSSDDEWPGETERAEANKERAAAKGRTAGAHEKSKPQQNGGES